jgi:hypothetical protein
MKINHPLVKGVVKEVKPFIYCVEIDDDYDRAMLFCRYQEFYESPYKKFRGKPFTWMEYMRFYKSSWKKRMFTYPDDWSGYNIPCNIIQQAHHIFCKDTEYDAIMNDIYWYCAKDSSEKNDNKQVDWYLIGASGKDLRTMDHEIAHGLYFTNKEYKKEITKLIKSIKPIHYEKLKKKLIKMGYVNDKKILDDEIQAFMSTGLYNGMDTKELKVYEKEFVKTFKKYKNENCGSKRIL